MCLFSPLHDFNVLSVLVAQEIRVPLRKSFGLGFISAQFVGECVQFLSALLGEQGEADVGMDRVLRPSGPAGDQ
jgi:hypothetical protein